MFVYAISGFNNSNYEGIFTLLFNSEEKMMAEVEDMIASDIDLAGELSVEYGLDFSPENKKWINL